MHLRNMPKGVGCVRPPSSRGCLLLLIVWCGSNAPRPRPKGGGDRVAASCGRVGSAGRRPCGRRPALPAAVVPCSALCRALRAGHQRYRRAYNPPRLAARRLCAPPSLRGGPAPRRLLGPRPGGGVCVPCGACFCASGGPAAKGPPRPPSPFGRRCAPSGLALAPPRGGRRGSAWGPALAGAPHRRPAFPAPRPRP